jgi:hypothetical protein
MADHRIEGPKGRMNFTCENKGFMTDVKRGFPHGKGNAKGSVFPEPLFDNGQYSLWLEHVLNRDDNSECFWLMWYQKGQSTIAASGVFSKSDILNVGRKLLDFISRED